MCYNPLERKKYTIIKNTMLQPSIYEMQIQAPEIAQLAKPGQFVNLYCKDQSKLLPRPISICEVDKQAGWVRLIYAVVGSGTRLFSHMSEGETIDVLGPLGHGFSLEDAWEAKEEAAKILIVGGGVGTPPLLELAKTLKRNYQDKVDLTIILGFRDDVYLAQEFSAYGKVYVSTDSGREGYHGHVVGLLEAQELEQKDIAFDYIYACGPTRMLRGLQSFGLRQNNQGEFSLEERMGCGFGGCVGCVVAIKQDEDFEYMKVCKDGPIFDYRKVIFS